MTDEITSKLLCNAPHSGELDVKVVAEVVPTPQSVKATTTVYLSTCLELEAIAFGFEHLSGALSCDAINEVKPGNHAHYLSLGSCVDVPRGHRSN